MKRLKSLIISLFILVVLLLTYYSLPTHNPAAYGTLNSKKLYASDGIITPPPKLPYVVSPR